MPKRVPNRVEAAIGSVVEAAIQVWVRTTGRTLEPGSNRWLEGPIGRRRVGDAVYAEYAAEAGLSVDRPGRPVGLGLLPDFDLLAGSDFDPRRVSPAVRDFYERTDGYTLEVRASWRGPFARFAQTLVYLVSRTIEQLNLPRTGADAALGMSSELLALRDRESGTNVLTGWLRRSPSTGRVVYAGFYGIARPPLGPGPCVKVVFPLPAGSATVILRPEHGLAGSLRLVSAGHAFGGPGYYRVHRTRSGTLRVRMVPISEVIHVFVDDSALRTTHTLAFGRFRFLTLDYLISARPG